jgi:hypothetical protein
MAQSHFDPNRYRWREVTGEPELSYKVRHDYTILGYEVRRRPSLHEELCQAIQDMLGPILSRHVDRQALTGVLVHHRQRPEWAPVVGAIEDEVV